MVHAGKAKSVADLFCGLGPFRAEARRELPRDRCIDSDQRAIDALTRAAQSHIRPEAGRRRKDATCSADRWSALELSGFDAVVFDPPRQGAEDAGARTREIEMPIVIAVSCNAATFARDAPLVRTAAIG